MNDPELIDLTFYFDPEPDPPEPPPAGVQSGWLYIGNPAPGEKLIALPGVTLTDGEGASTFVPTGEATEVTVIE